MTENRPLALVTGASRGIGAELARLFAEHGHDLIVVAEDAAIGDTAERLRRAGTDVHAVTADLATFRPTFLLAVPRVFEKVYNGAEAKAAASGRGGVFTRAAATAVAWSEAQDSGGPSLGLRAQHALFDRLVYGKLRAAVGGRVKAAVSGSAPHHFGDRLPAFEADLRALLAGHAGPGGVFSQQLREIVLDVWRA